MRYRILSMFCIICVLFNTITFNVFAGGGGGARTDLETWDDWTWTEKATFFNSHFGNILLSSTGALFGDGGAALFTAFMNYLYEYEILIENDETYTCEEWLLLQYLP